MASEDVGKDSDIPLGNLSFVAYEYKQKTIMFFGEEHAEGPTIFGNKMSSILLGANAEINPETYESMFRPFIIALNKSTPSNLIEILLESHPTNIIDFMRQRQGQDPERTLEQLQEETKTQTCLRACALIGRSHSLFRSKFRMYPVDMRFDAFTSVMIKKAAVEDERRKMVGDERHHFFIAAIEISNILAEKILTLLSLPTVQEFEAVYIRDMTKKYFDWFATIFKTPKIGLQLVWDSMADLLDCYILAKIISSSRQTVVFIGGKNHMDEISAMLEELEELRNRVHK